jgi:type II secretory pathway component GspD/PulD (secretin)
LSVTIFFAFLYASLADDLISLNLVLGQVGKESLSVENASAGVELNFENEIEIKDLIDMVSKRLGINILYDEQILNKKVNIRSPIDVPPESLLSLLQSALQMKDLVLQDAGSSGWKQIVQTAKLPAVAPIGDVAETIKRSGSGTGITQVIVLRHADASSVDQGIKPFLSKPGGNSLAVNDQRMIIVTDYSENVARIKSLIELMDSPRAEVLIEFVPLQHTVATETSEKIGKLLEGQKQAVPVASAPGAPTSKSRVTADERTNQLILTGTRSEIAAAKELVKKLDVPPKVTTKVYQMRHVSAERIDDVMNDLFDPEKGDVRYRAAVDTDANKLFVTATPQQHKKIGALVKSLDVPPPEDQGHIQLYKLHHSSSWEVLSTLRALEGSDGYGSPFPMDEYGSLRGISGGGVRNGAFPRQGRQGGFGGGFGGSGRLGGNLGGGLQGSNRSAFPRRTGFNDLSSPVPMGGMGGSGLRP